MKRLLKFSQMSTSDRLFLLSTFLLLGLVRLGLWLLPFQTLQQVLAKISHTDYKRQKAEQISIGKIVWAINISSRLMPGGVKCLVRALTTQVLMSRYGYSPQLCIGVAKGEEGLLEAHAWVESGGKVVIGYLNDLTRFTPMSSIKD